MWEIALSVPSKSRFMSSRTVYSCSPSGSPVRSKKGCACAARIEFVITRPAPAARKLRRDHADIGSSPAGYCNPKNLQHFDAVKLVGSGAQPHAQAHGAG